MQTVQLQRLVKTAEKNLKKPHLNIPILQPAASPKTIGCVTPWDHVHHFVYPMLSDHFHNPFSFPRFTSDWFLPAPPRVLLILNCYSRHCPGDSGLASPVWKPMFLQEPGAATFCASWLWKQKKSQSKSSADYTWQSVNNIYTAIPYSHYWHLMANFPLLINAKIYLP